MARDTDVFYYPWETPGIPGGAPPGEIFQGMGFEATPPWVKKNRVSVFAGSPMLPGGVPPGPRFPGQRFFRELPGGYSGTPGFQGTVWRVS